MYTDKDDLLAKAKDLLKEEMTTISYTTWIKNLEIQSIIDDKIVLVAFSILLILLLIKIVKQK